MRGAAHRTARFAIALTDGFGLCPRCTALINLVSSSSKRIGWGVIFAMFIPGILRYKNGKNFFSLSFYRFIPSVPL